MSALTCERTDEAGNRTAFMPFPPSQGEGGGGDRLWPGVFCRTCSEFVFNFDEPRYTPSGKAYCAQCAAKNKVPEDRRVGLLRGMPRICFLALTKPLSLDEVVQVTDQNEKRVIEALLALQGKGFAQKDNLGRWCRTRVVIIGSR